jgi:hypothetical protein
MFSSGKSVNVIVWKENNMPLFDFFKKSNKKQPGAQTDNDKFFSPEQNKKRYDAAMEFVKAFQEKTPLLNGRPHAGTVLSIGAHLAGTSLFRAINKKEIDPGAVVLSEEVNQAYTQLLNLFAYYCKQNGIDVMAKPLVQEIPEGDKPRMDLPQIQAEYQDQYNEIMNKHGLDYLEGARAGMILCSIFFHYHCIANKDIDPYVATGIVGRGVVEGAKTSLVPLNSKGATAKPTKGKKDNQVAGLLQTVASSSISGSGARLVLGRGMAPMKEAQANGGKYMLANPGVLIKLEKSNIDPFLVYEAALRMELESKISQIDVVNANVDELVQEWSGKSLDQAPMYVRQLLWLKANAEKYGYQQSGNSWKLK